MEPARVEPKRPAAQPAPASCDDTAEMSVPAFLRMPAPEPADREAELGDDVRSELDAVAKYGEEPTGVRVFEPGRDLHMPLGLIAAGLFLAIGAFCWESGAGAGGIPFAVFAVGANTLVQVTVMLIGVLIAARFASINFGPAGPALLKLCAGYLLPNAVGGLVTTMLGGDMAVACLGGAVSAVLYWSLVSYLFRFDGRATMTCVSAITGARVLSMVFLGGLLIAAAGGSTGNFDGNKSKVAATQDEAEVVADTAGDYGGSYLD